MALSIYNLIESVCNPAGRFKTLREIGVKTDEKGDPVFSYSGTTISFSVVWKGRSYLLKCSLREEQENTLSWRRIAAYLQRIRSSFLVGYYYLSGEMLVFNDRGAAGYIDVVLMEYPDHMQPLDEFLEKACMEGDKERIRKLLTEFCQMAVWLINDNLVHGAIRASNVMIDKDCSVHLVNYEYMQMPRSDAPDYESIRDADNVMVANLALGIKAVASDPAAFRYLRGNAIFRFPVVRSPLLPMFADVAREAGLRTGVADRRNAFVQQSYVARSFGVERSVAEIGRRPYGIGCRFVGKTGERTETVRCGAGRQRCPAGGVPAEPYAASVVLLLGRAGLRIVDLRPQGRSVGLCGLFRE